MPRFLFPAIAALGLAGAAWGIWSGGLRNEVTIAQSFEQLPRLSDTPFFRCADSFYWVSYAREMVETGKLRVRFTRMDNAPYGRPNDNWASLNAWYLAILGKVWSVATGIPWSKAILPAALWSGPILYLLALFTILALGCYARNLPSAAAAVLVLGTTPRVFDDFAYAVPGHHGWHDLASLATIALLAIAVLKHARWCFAAAGVAGAIAIWVGATQQLFGLAAAGFGALGGMIICRFARRTRSSPLADETPDLAPAECWRAFGIAGALAALIFYLIEYAPGRFAMRLEVNHPIYAFGFFLGGEFLCRAQRILFTARPQRKDKLAALISAAGLALIPVIVLAGPLEWHTMKQPFMQRLHQEIAEFQPMTPGSGLLMLATPIFLTALATWRAFIHGQAARYRIALLVCACPTAAAILLTFVQLRWAGIAGACAAALASVLFLDHTTSGVVEQPGLTSLAPVTTDQKWARSDLKVSSAPFACATWICLLSGLTLLWNVAGNREDLPRVRAEIVDRLATMEVASVLQADSKVANPIAIFCGQKEREAWINYVTNIRSVGSLYWDNPLGMRDEAEFLATYDEEAAHRIARRRGLNYVVVSPSGGNIIAYHYIWQGNKDDPRIRQTLAYRLTAPNPSPPHWLQPVLCSSPAIRSEHLRVYRVL